MALAPNPQHSHPDAIPFQTIPPRPAPIPIAPPRHNLLVLWHLLSLDAPSVAAVWTWYLAAASHIHLPWTSIAAMATAVWLLYAADRLLDSRILLTSPTDPPGIEARHRFHHRHRSHFRIGIALASLLLALLLPTLPAEAIHLYLAEGSFLAGYFLLIHAIASPFRLPKELAVGLFFAAAVFIPAVSRVPALRHTLLAPALLFAVLCTLNCLYIYAWEHPFRTPATAHFTTRLALRHLRALSLTLLLAALALTATSAPRLIPAAIALATALLLALHHSRRALTPTTLRAAADLALLTPLLFLPFA